MLNGKAMMILLIVRLIKETQYKCVNIFLNDGFFFWGGGGDVKVELDLTNYVTQADF